MKKLLVIATMRRFSGILSKSTLIPVLALGLGLTFWTATAPVVKAQTTNQAVAPEAPINIPDKGRTTKPGKGGGTSGKCDVCHNPHNYHTISIPCDQVDKFLSNHPGDFRGRCEATPVANP